MPYNDPERISYEVCDVLRGKCIISDHAIALRNQVIVYNEDVDIAEELTVFADPCVTSVEDIIFYYRQREDVTIRAREKDEEGKTVEECLYEAIDFETERIRLSEDSFKIWEKSPALISYVHQMEKALAHIIAEHPSTKDPVEVFCYFLNYYCPEWEAFVSTKSLYDILWYFFVEIDPL